VSVAVYLIGDGRVAAHPVPDIAPYGYKREEHEDYDPQTDEPDAGEQRDVDPYIVPAVIGGHRGYAVDPGVLSEFILLELVSLSYQPLNPQEDRHHPHQADPLLGHHEDAERTEHAKGDQRRETELLAQDDVPDAENRVRLGEEQHKDEEVVYVGRSEGQATRDYRFKYPAHS
jgi:hypothetical protein